MNIGETAERSGLPAKTIRYYEDIKLIEPKRDANGYRNFDESDLHKLAFLARARSLGFNIDDCRHLLALFADQSRASSDVKKLAKSQLLHIDQKLSELQSMRDTLANLVTACAGNDRPDCPILEDFGKLKEPAQK